MFNVDERELRDYETFVARDIRDYPKSFTGAFDEAYAQYIGLNAERHIRWFLERRAPFWGIVPRHLTEAWEVSSNFWPSTYPESLKIYA